MQTNSVLDQIVAAKSRELERTKREISITALEERIGNIPMPLNLSGALMGDGVRLIAEVKRASPSKGALNLNINPGDIAKTYAENGAAAISVLTEVDHFQGSLNDLATIKDATASQRLPILRKDFIFDPYQVHESRAAGADAILLIVAILSPTDLKELIRISGSFYLQCLVEVHNELELSTALKAGAEIIGINNRDLHTFTTNLEVTKRLSPLVPSGKIIVSESGINNKDDVQSLRTFGVNSILVGEALMTANDIGAKIRELV